MALIITATPAALSSLHGDLIYTVSETTKTADPATYPNYKFIGDVYIGATLVARLKAVPNPVTKIGRFSIGQSVRNYLATTFNPANAIISQRMGAGEFSLTITMKFGEEYSYTAYTNITIDSARTFFNNYNGRLVGASTSLAADRPVSNRPLISAVDNNATTHLVPYLPSTTTAFTLTINSYDYSNTLYSTTTASITPATAYELIVCNLSPAVLNAFSAGIIAAGVKYYTVQFGAGGVVMRFNLSCEVMYDVYTLFFLNKYGGFESKEFTKVSRKTIDITKKDFGKLPYQIDAAGSVTYHNSNGVYNEMVSVYAATFKEKMILNSDLLTDSEYRWLQELVLSPMVYVQEGNYYYPCKITESNYEQKKVVNDELTNLTLSIEFGDILNSQFR